jgi:hypothetical protein
MPAGLLAVPDKWPQSLVTSMTSGVTMLQLFQPGVAIMAQQLLGNHTLMQVRVGVILLLSPRWSFKSR